MRHGATRLNVVFACVVACSLCAAGSAQGAGNAGADLDAVANSLQLAPAYGGGGGAGGAAGGGAAEALPTYSISGRIHTPGDEGVWGVVLNGLPGNPSTTGVGAYAGTVPQGWSGTVQPVKSGWTFVPTSRTYTQPSSNFVDQDYVATGVAAVRVYVDARNTGAQTGQSWGTAFRTIQQGIDSAFSKGGGDVWVAMGTYMATTDPVVMLREFVGVYGGFQGNESSFDDRDVVNYRATIDGENVRRCVVGNDAAALDGFIIARGYATHGAGLCNQGVSPDVANCLFQFNSAQSAYSESSDLAQIAVALPLSAGGGGGGFGGGAAGAGGGGAIESVVAYYGTGGAVYNDQADPGVFNCVFDSNTASDGGGAMQNTEAAAWVANCIFWNNTAGEPSLDLNALAASLTLAEGQGGGGGGAAGPSRGGVAEAVLSYGTGGAIQNESCSPSVVNCTFYGNEADNGGAIFNVDASPVVTNSILWGDQPNEIAGTPTGGSDVNYSDVQGGYPSGAGNLFVNPLFEDMVLGDFHLQSGSLCIDSGTSAGAPDSDLDGVARPQGGGFDMGAYER